MSRSKTSWEAVHDWYDHTVGEEGHYYHQHVLLPNLQRLLGVPRKLLDVGCGQGILSRHLPKKTDYFGIDISQSLISKAKKMQPFRAGNFAVEDATKPFSLKERDFSHAAIVLALQNMADPLAVFKNLNNHLTEEGHLLIVLNHPCFRIPRQSGWEIDLEKKLQSRRIDLYMSSLEIPIQTHPSQKNESSTSLTFHNPLSAYSKFLSESSFTIELIEEWCSDKVSSGGAARMENRARREFPLFLTIVARKKSSLCYPPQQRES